MFEQSELDDSNYMSFVAMLTQYGRERRVRRSCPTTSSCRTRAYHAHIASLLEHLRRAVAAATASAGRWRRWCTRRPTASAPGPAASRCCRSRSRSATSSTASSGSSRRRRRARPRPRSSAPIPTGRRRLLTRVVHPASIDPLDLCDPVRYAARGYPDDVWAQLRAEAPIAWFEPEGYEPFWAVTKHADITRRGVAAGAVLQRARAHDRPEGRAGAADRDGRHRRPAPARPAAPHRHAPADAARDPRPQRRHRAARARRARRHHRRRQRRRGVRLRRSTSPRRCRSR